MWWGIGIGGFILYVFLLLFTLGVMNAQKRSRVAVLLRDLLPVALADRGLHATEPTGGGLRLAACRKQVA